MANNRMLLVYKPTGAAFAFAKRMGSGWYLTIDESLAKRLQEFFDQAEDAWGVDAPLDAFALAMESTDDPAPSVMTNFVYVWGEDHKIVGIKEAEEPAPKVTSVEDARAFAQQLLVHGDESSHWRAVPLPPPSDGDYDGREFSHVQMREYGRDCVKAAREWIKTSDRLPTERKAYNVARENQHGRWVESAYFDPTWEPSGVWLLPTDVDDPIFDVTHWQPLPEPPKPATNPATILGELAPEFPRERIRELEAICEAPITNAYMTINMPYTTVYTVIALRGGRPMQSGGTYYYVGCYATEAEAVAAATLEESERGLKYECEVVEWTVGVGIAERCGTYPFSESGSPVRIVRSPEE